MILSTWLRIQKVKKKIRFVHQDQKEDVFTVIALQVKITSLSDKAVCSKIRNCVPRSCVCVKLTHFYRIIEFVSVFAAISELAICKVCKRNLNFEETGIHGLGFKIAVKCACGTRLIDSGPLRNTGYEINHRIIFAMRLLGIGLQGLNLFISLMDISKGLSKGTYDRVVQHIHECTKLVFDAMCLRVVEQEKKENEKRERPLLDFKVSGDGSWKKTRIYFIISALQH